MNLVAQPLARPLSRSHHRTWGLLAGLALLLVLALLSLAIGSRAIPLSVTWQALQAPDLHNDLHNDQHLILRELRLPRTLIALLAGLAQGGAGAVMQAVTRNPLAEPGLLGINAGAAVAV
ncbi:iron chelate uptake ABC transporter family permease subunit, partial [Pseudomonas protegens]|uniref:iron chelate uptake ABC transporter family permease subunit n=1 Tax=Pseudomonas protegens TaxID=380021 RepID=UPI0034D74211